MSTQYNITKDAIDDIRAGADIVAVIGRYVELKQRGNRHLGRCPFHDEKTPSFNVTPEKQMFYCFGCHTGGDVFKFLMLHESMSFPDAVVELAREAGVELQKKSKQSQAQEARKATLVAAHELAMDFYHEQLGKEANQAPRKYLLDRGLGQDVIDKYKIGFAPDEYEALMKAVKGKISDKEMEQAGLANLSSRGSYIDRFRGRIMVPIYNTGGRLVAFGGRVFGDGEPKYLNTAETPIFQKSSMLFGLFQGMRAVRKRNFAILVEGYFDVIVLQMAGFENSVAPMGTALTESQASLLKRYCEKVIICMDDDTAGKKAAVRSAGVLLEKGFAVNIATLSQGDDPDSFIQNNGKEAFQELLKQSDPAYYSVMKDVAARTDLTRPIGMKSALTELIPLLSKISEPMERSHAITTTSKTLNIEQHLVLAELRKIKPGRVQKQAESPAEFPSIPRMEKELLVAAQKDVKSAELIVAELGILDYVTLFTRKVLEAFFERAESGKDISINFLSELADDEEEQRLLAELAVKDETAANADARECSIAIAIQAVKKELSKINDSIASMSGAAAKGKGDSSDLYTKKTELTLKIHKLEDLAAETGTTP
jgi:DNA primase